MTQESSAEAAGLTSTDVLRIFGATLGVAALTAAALFLLFIVLFGQAMGGIISSLSGRGAAVMSDGKVLAIVLVIFAAQLGLSPLVASQITTSARKPSARKLALGLSLFLCLLPVLWFSVMNRSMHTRHQDLNRQLEQKLEEERLRRRAESEARIAEMQKRLEFEQEQQRRDEAALLELKKKLAEETKRSTSSQRPRKTR